MPFFLHPSRRNFLKTIASAFAAFVLPKSLFAGKSDKAYWFVQIDTGNAWPVTNPVRWSLENANQPVLSRATEGLLKLTASDRERIIRLVVRRCRLNLIELNPGHVLVQHWGQQGQADLRPFFKAHHLTRRDVEVVVFDRKNEIQRVQSGDDFLFGDRLSRDWPLDLYRRKWNGRHKHESDDDSASPGSPSGYAWIGVENNRIPWAALKSAWRRKTASHCLNCDQPTILTYFGNPWVGMFNRRPHIVHACLKCQRSFEEPVKNMEEWMAMTLDVEDLPDFVMMWNIRVKREG